MTKITSDKVLIGFDTSAIIGISEQRLTTFVKARGVPCVTPGILLELGDREDRIKQPAFRKIKKFGFVCLKEPIDILKEEADVFGKSKTTFSPLMPEDHAFKFQEAVENLVSSKSMPDYECFRQKRIARKNAWWSNELIGKKFDSSLDEISHYELEGLAEAKFKKGVTDGLAKDEDSRVKKAFATYKDLVFEKLPPAFKGWLYFDAFVNLIRPLKKEQTKSVKVRLKHATGTLELKIDPNTLDDMRHFLLSLPYLDLVVTCDITMHRLLSIFHLGEQEKIKMLNRNPGPSKPQQGTT